MGLTALAALPCARPPGPEGLAKLCLLLSALRKQLVLEDIKIENSCTEEAFSNSCPSDPRRTHTVPSRTFKAERGSSQGTWFPSPGATNK